METTRPHTDPDNTPESGYTLAEPITFTPLPESHNLCVYGPDKPGRPRLLVTVDTRTGAVTFGDGVTPDEAARVFWEAVSHAAPEAPEVREARAKLVDAALAERRADIAYGGESGASYSVERIETIRAADALIALVDGERKGGAECS